VRGQARELARELAAMIAPVRAGTTGLVRAGATAPVPAVGTVAVRSRGRGLALRCLELPVLQPASR
jgi:hypothetical protein